MKTLANQPGTANPLDSRLVDAVDALFTARFFGSGITDEFTRRALDGFRSLLPVVAGALVAGAEQPRHNDLEGAARRIAEMLVGVARRIDLASAVASSPH